jgi:hypothetical protein
MGEDFLALLRQRGIRDTLIGVRNPQANALCEGMHQVVGIFCELLYILTLHRTKPMQLQSMVDYYALRLAVYAMRTTVHRTLGIAPGSLIFYRDMIMDLLFVADLLLLRNIRQELIDYNLRRENYKRRNFDCQPGQWV